VKVPNLIPQLFKLLSYKWRARDKLLSLHSLQLIATAEKCLPFAEAAYDPVKAMLTTPV